jgi:hypothetical protein
MPVTQLDLRKGLKPLYGPRTQAEFVKVPQMKYIMVDGRGEHGSESFQQAIGVLYGLAYTLKFMSKRLLRNDFTVMALEGLWWTKGRFDPTKRDQWLWTLMIMQLDFITDKMFHQAVE